jgi:hypothetical protein
LASRQVQVIQSSLTGTAIVISDVNARLMVLRGCAAMCSCLLGLHCSADPRGRAALDHDRIVTGQNAWVLTWQVARGIGPVDIGQLDSSDAVTAEVCSRRAALGAIVLEPGAPKPRCGQADEPLETFAVAHFTLVLAVHADNHWMRAVPRETWDRLALIADGRLPLWSDIDPSWPSEFVDLYAPDDDSELHGAFTSAVGAWASRRLATSPTGGLEPEYCRDRHALAWVSAEDAERCKMRAVEDATWQAALLVFRHSSADPSDRASRLWHALGRAFAEPRRHARAL